jgi:uncharacterized protein (TIGR02453 family)
MLDTYPTPSSDRTMNGLSPELFVFLRDLQKNNNKDWFGRNKQRYVDVIQRPMLEFIATMAPWLAAHMPAFTADMRTNGGSLFRIHRDTRFSNDKSPYKTNVGCNFRHRAGKDAHAPGFYVHIEPGKIFFGGGIWSPPTPVLNKIRDAIVENPKRWQSVKQARQFATVLGGLADAPSLKNAPEGYARDHKFVEDLKRKSLFAFSSCSEAEVCAADFPDRVKQTFDALAPLMKFMVDALDLSWEK